MPPRGHAPMSQFRAGIPLPVEILPFPGRFHPKLQPHSPAPTPPPSLILESFRKPENAGVRDLPLFVSAVSPPSAPPLCTLEGGATFVPQTRDYGGPRLLRRRMFTLGRILFARARGSFRQRRTGSPSTARTGHYSRMRPSRPGIRLSSGSWAQFMLLQMRKWKLNSREAAGA